jgi:glycosyltransferase involved in cell wall biosynthesis
MQTFPRRGSDDERVLESAPHREGHSLSKGTGIAVLIPCFNEAATIATVVRSFKAAVPAADIYVYDNNSTDQTISLAEAAGATVRREPLQGKGNVVRRMFADVEADVYVMVDGDSTYDPAHTEDMIALLHAEKLDMVVAARVALESDAYRYGHRFGNKLLTRAVAHLFGNRFTDMLSGYRVFSRRFVKSFPAMSTGFEIETELTIHALELSLPVAEVETPYTVRIQGSVSKLNTYTDGLKILRLILVLYKNERPLQFFSAIAAVLLVTALSLGIPLVITFLETGLVFRQPTAILSTGLVLLAALSFVTGLILDTVTRGRREIKRLAYLSIKAP